MKQGLNKNFRAQVDKAQAGGPEPGNIPPCISPYLQESLLAFSAITKLPVSFYDKNHELRWESLPGGSLCNLSGVYQKENSPCTVNLSAAMDFAATTGEPYIFVCHSGLIKIAVTLFQKKKIKGCFIAGPLSMGPVSESVFKKIFTSNDHLPGVEARLALFAGKMPIFKPKEVSQLAILFNNCVLSAVGTAEDYMELHNQYNSQVKLGIDMRKYKETNKDMKYPFDLEDLLIAKVKAGDSGEAQKAFHKLLKELALLESGDLSATKAHMLGVLGVLERMAFLNELPPIEYSTVYLLNEVTNYTELEALVSGLIQQICQSARPAIYEGGSKLIQEALQFIYENQSKQFSLATLAQHLHINASYLSTLFRREVGMTFSEYLNELRIKRAEQLLTDTHKSLMEIALESGFENQSYFSKVFKKKRGQNPKDYRAEHKHNMQ